MRHALALHVAPLLLRVGLGLTFVWAGAAKLTQEMPVTDANRAQLAAWGVIEGNPEEPDTTPQDVLPDRDPIEDDLPAVAPDEPPSEADGITTPDPEPQPADEQAAAAPTASLVALQTELPQSVRRVYGLALLIHARANPMPNDDGTPAMALWPKALAANTLPVYFAWGAAVTELIAGVAVLFGFFTRLGSLPLAGTMAVAMWLTQVGPALQTGNATLGVLPPGMFELSADGYVYTQFLWQIALLLMGLALFCTGPGFLSIDRLLFGPLETSRPSYDPEDDGNVELVPMAGRRAIRPSADD